MTKRPPPPAGRVLARQFPATMESRPTIGAPAPLPKRGHSAHTSGNSLDGRETFTFFWKGSPFSQWAGIGFEIDGIRYSHAEQWMMAEKARLFGDEATLRLILQARDPKTQKALGRKVAPFDEDRWNAVVKEVLLRGNRAKFEQNPAALRALMDSEGTTLVEASPYDRIYGIGLGAGDRNATDRTKWRGKNWLGEVLTGLRAEFDAELKLAGPRI